MSLRANIVFDLDGTLIDSAPDIQKVANSLLAKRHLDPIDIKTTRDFIGRGAAAFITQLSAARGIDETQRSQILAEFLTSYEGAINLTRPYRGVERALSQLKKHYLLGVCTNKPYRLCLSVLNELGLDKFFTTVTGGDSLPVLKPDPLALLSTFEKMDAGPRIYVGDSEIDAETALRAGVPFLLFSEGYRKLPVEQIPHDAAFTEFAELPEIVVHSIGSQE